MLVPYGRPLLGDTRTGATLTLAACVTIVVALGLLFHGQAGPDAFDQAADASVVTFFAGHHGLLLWLALPGTVIPAIVISAAIAAGCLIARRLNGAVLAVITVPAAAALDDALLKHLFHRTYLGYLAFPSGHTTAATALTATLAVLLLVPPQRTQTRRPRAALVALACAVTVTVATAVVGLRWHYLTDTVAGAAVGIAVVMALALVLDVTRRPGRRHARRPMTPSATTAGQKSESSAESLDSETEFTAAPLPAGGAARAGATPSPPGRAIFRGQPLGLRPRSASGSARSQQGAAS
jgi:membrane-associated phospholipid phosphatase